MIGWPNSNSHQHTMYDEAMISTVEETDVTLTPIRAKRRGSLNSWEGSKAESVIWAVTAESFVPASFMQHQEKNSEVLRVEYTAFLNQGESIRKVLYCGHSILGELFNPLNTELNPICQ